MISVVSFEPDHVDQVVALWRLLHPDWTWLDDAPVQDEIFRGSAATERIRYVVRNDTAVIATVFSSCSRDATRPRNRFIHVEAAPADISAEWLDIVLASLVDVDRGQPDAWHVANLSAGSTPALTQVLEAAGFVHHSSMLQMEWCGEAVAVVDPAPARCERYAGGNLDTDRAIVDLQNRMYRRSRLVPPATVEGLWKPQAALRAHEYVLAREHDRLVGYSEWLEADGTPPYVNDFVVARSHWGTPVATAVGTKTMQILIERGHHKLEASVRSNNTAALRLHRQYGWKVAYEAVATLVRKL
jgi:hypothetical protein